MKDTEKIDAVESFLKVAFKIIPSEMFVQSNHVASTPRIHAGNLAPQSLAAKGFAGQIHGVSPFFAVKSAQSVEFYAQFNMRSRDALPACDVVY
ncbi:hypothetical protein [Shinella sumterensis]|uniref:hypothetical protein n=1 Tax=Shinella sumterensis TaxID=1967501 RepID=UPI00106EABE3|nr:hypothetical protein [Shinella sumterensis]MCD1265888.1 hypothetical protein [Shinella sumterensis]